MLWMLFLGNHGKNHGKSWENIGKHIRETLQNKWKHDHWAVSKTDKKETYPPKSLVFHFPFRHIWHTRPVEVPRCAAILKPWRNPSRASHISWICAWVSEWIITMFNGKINYKWWKITNQLYFWMVFSIINHHKPSMFGYPLIILMEISKVSNSSRHRQTHPRNLVDLPGASRPRHLRNKSLQW